MSKYTDLMDKVALRGEVKEEVEGMYQKEQRGEVSRGRQVFAMGSKGFGAAGRKKAHSTGRILRPACVAAACLAVVITANLVLQSYEVKNTGKQETAQSADTAIPEKIAEQVKHAFSIKVSAAELSKEKAVPSLPQTEPQAEEEKSALAVDKFAGNEALTGDGKTVEYSFQAPITCEGAEIAQITYRINKGTFQLVGEKGKSPVLSGKKEKGFRNFPITATNAHEELWYYREFTVDYETQKNPNYDLNICGRGKDTGDIFGTKKVKKLKKGMDTLIGDTVITCIVQFKDGTEQTEKIQVGTEILKWSEVDSENEKYQLPELKNRESVFVTYQLQ